MAWRDKDIEDLKARYSEYLRTLDSDAIAYLADDPALMVEKTDEITPVIERLEAEAKSAAEAEAYEYLDALRWCIGELEGIL